MADVPWSSDYPSAQDNPVTDNQPDLDDGADTILSNHPETLRDKLQAVAWKVGDDSDLPAGSHAARLTTLEAQIITGSHKEIFNMDFTVQSTQDLTSGGDGDKTIGGKTFYADNTANASKMAITNGVGLEIDCSTANSDIINTTRTAPILGIRLPDIVSGLCISNVDSIRAWIIFTDNADQNFEQINLMFERKHAGPFDGPSYHYWRGYKVYSGGLQFSGANGFNGGNHNDAGGSTDALTDDVMMIQMRAASFWEIYTGASVGGDFPAITNMRLRNVMPVPTDTPLRFDSAAEQALAIAVASVNASGTLETTFTRMKVETK